MYIMLVFILSKRLLFAATAADGPFTCLNRATHFYGRRFVHTQYAHTNKNDNNKNYEKIIIDETIHFTNCLHKSLCYGGRNNRPTNKKKGKV